MIYLDVKHEYSISDKLFTPSDFPELEIRSFFYSYSAKEELESHYRLSINIQLYSSGSFSIAGIEAIESLVNNVFVYDVEYKGTRDGFYEEN